MFEHEVALWFSLNHPHVVKIGCHTGTPFFVCEEATNSSLDKYVKNHPSEVWTMLYEAALGLEYLHARGISSTETSSVMTSSSVAMGKRR